MTDTTTKKPTRKKAARKAEAAESGLLKKRKMARALVFSVMTTREQAAAHFQTTARTIGRWEARLKTDEDLRREFEAQMALADKVWLGDAKVLFRKTAHRILELLPTVEKIRELQPLLRDLSSMLVQHEALVGGPEDHPVGAVAPAHPEGPPRGASTVH